MKEPPKLKSLFDPDSELLYQLMVMMGGALLLFYMVGGACEFFQRRIKKHDPARAGMFESRYFVFVGLDE